MNRSNPENSSIESTDIESNAVLLVMCNVPDISLARHMAEVLVTQGLAACVNVLPEVESVYRWQGALERTAEIPLLIKTRRAAYPALEQALQRLHPYQVPEIIALPIATGLPAYLGWVAVQTGQALSSDDRHTPA